MICFCPSDSQVGVLRVWNVSRSTPLDSFKLKKTGFHALHVLNSPLAKKGTVFSKRAVTAGEMRNTETASVSVTMEQSVRAKLNRHPKSTELFK